MSTFMLSSTFMNTIWFSSGFVYLTCSTMYLSSRTPPWLKKLSLVMVSSSIACMSAVNVAAHDRTLIPVQTLGWFFIAYMISAITFAGVTVPGRPGSKKLRNASALVMVSCLIAFWIFEPGMIIVAMGALLWVIICLMILLFCAF